MPIEVHQFPCLSDNYGFLVRDLASGEVACIDTPDAAVILREADRLAWPINFIFNTHWHPDHAGGNEEVKAATGALVIAPREVERSSAIDRLVAEGDEVLLGQTCFRVMETGGHTLEHIAYYSAAERCLFIGDTLFPMGCGRLFEGTAAQMWQSLSRLAELPAETVVYSAHEYTQANCRFALSIDDSPAVRKRSAEVDAMRARGEATVPTTIGLERLTNPFLRAPELLRDERDAARAFARIRRAKDDFKG